MHTRTLLLVVLLTASALAGCADNGGTSTVSTPNVGSPSAGGDADFGDAEGAFPTKRADDGARVLDVSQARLGAQATTEADALSPDADDGLVEMVLVLTQLPPPATLTVEASAPAGSPGGTFYLNVLFDRGLDGAWAGGDWVVQNQPVQLAAGETKQVQTDPFALTESLLLPEGAWMRVALTKERATDWTGTGEFSAGEIEDHVVTFPEVGGKKPAIAVMKCPERVTFGGAASVAVSCDIANVAPAGHGSDIRWSLTRQTGGVTIGTASGNVVVAPGASTTVSFTATKGEPLPSAWRYNAVGIDPPSRATATGVEIGHGESEGAIDFVETAKACAIFIAEIETSREHRTGESDAIFWVYVKRYFEDALADAQASEDARVTATTADGQEIVGEGANEEGAIELRQTVYSYGEYPIDIQGVEADGCTFDAENSVLSATASVQPGPN